MSRQALHVSLIAVPESLVAPVTGLYEGLFALGRVLPPDHAAAGPPPYRIEIVGPSPTVVCRANGLSLATHRRFEEVEHSDIVIAPSMMTDGTEWSTGRNDEAVDWMRAQYARGARLCGACSGALLVAETGLLDGWEATVHPAFADTFRRNFPGVHLRLESVLVPTGRNGELVTSGASAAWHDLLLYLVARDLGVPAAQALARFMLLQWHEDGQGPYITFSPPTTHGDTPIRRAQEWLWTHYADATALADMCRVAGLPERSFKRRFKSATGYPPLSYLQHLRVEEAKRRLERTDDPADAVAGQVGYENAAFFRRLFKRQTGITPGSYRRRFRIPGIAGAGARDRRC